MTTRALLPSPTKWIVALLALVSASSGLACPPALPSDPVPPPRAELVRGAAQRAPNIVYAVVEQAVGAWKAVEQRRLVRILHVYKGDLRVGQRIWFTLDRARSECAPAQPAEITALEGDYGLLLLPVYREGDEMPELPEFLYASDAGDLIRAGIIRSAREANVAEPAPRSRRKRGG